MKTSDDFGAQGELPSHPELLDWLAVSWRQDGWDTKGLIRMNLTSGTFRQSAVLTPDVLRMDPENRLHARGPRFRLDAEQIRDNALYVGGLLNQQMGGRGVMPYHHRISGSPLVMKTATRDSIFRTPERTCIGGASTAS